jgi:2-aminoadipate transaminase
MNTEMLADLYSERVRNTIVRSPSLYPSGDQKFQFAQGLPYAPLIPIEAIRECFDTVLRDDGANACTYYSPEGGGSEMKFGFVGLREQIAGRLSARSDHNFDARNVLLTNGSIDGLTLTAATFLSPGDGAVTESPTFSPVPTAMEAIGAIVRAVPIDDDGMDIIELEKTFLSMSRDGIRPKLIYTIPTFQLPTGTVMSLRKRQQLLDLAHVWNVVILEDNCYYELAYDDQPPPSLLSLDRNGIVVQSDSTSKYIAPGLRLGWMAGSPELIEGLARARQDFGVGQVVARAISRYFELGYFDEHIAVLRDAYRVKRDITASALEKYCKPFAHFRIPSGGFYFWLVLSSDIDFSMAKQRISEAGIAVRYGDAERFAPESPAIRICPIPESDEMIVAGIEALGNALALSRRGG